MKTKKLSKSDKAALRNVTKIVRWYRVYGPHLLPMLRALIQAYRGNDMKTADRIAKQLRSETGKLARRVIRGPKGPKIDSPPAF